MRKKIIIFILFFLTAVAEISLFPNFFPRNISPDALLISIIILSSGKNFKNFWPWAAFSGLIVDLFSFARVGPSVISFVLISWGVSFFTKRFFPGEKGHLFLFVAVSVAVGIFTNYFLVFFLNFMADYFSGNLVGLGEKIIFQTWLYKIINGLILYAIIYYPVFRIRSIFSSEEKSLVVK